VFLGHLAIDIENNGKELDRVRVDVEDLPRLHIGAPWTEGGEARRLPKEERQEGRESGAKKK